jgi:4-hydroxy-4-methyl-2-oxoglutarate aldolase
MTEILLDRRVRTAMVSDSLDVVGVRNNVMNSSIQALRPEMRAVGFAATIEFEPSSEFDQRDPYGAAIDFLDRLNPGQLAVVATGGRDDSAFWGELFSAAAKGRGATGMVCDGPLRDTEAVVGLGFNVFGASNRPIDYKGRMRVASVGTIVICGGVEVHPGDAVIADADGVVVVPKIHIARVFELANARAQSEKSVLKDLLAGKSVREVWDAYGVL